MNGVAKGMAIDMKLILIFTMLMLTACNVNDTTNSEINDDDTAIILDLARIVDIQLSVEIDGDVVIETLQNLSYFEPAFGRGLTIIIGDPVFEYFNGQSWKLIQRVKPKERFLPSPNFFPSEREEHFLNDYIIPEHTLLRLTRNISVSQDGKRVSHKIYIEFDLSD